MGFVYVGVLFDWQQGVSSTSRAYRIHCYPSLKNLLIGLIAKLESIEEHNKMVWLKMSNIYVVFFILLFDPLMKKLWFEMFY